MYSNLGTAGSQAKQALPQNHEVGGGCLQARSRRPSDLHDNTGASIASAKSMREGFARENGLKLIVDETLRHTRRRNVAGPKNRSANRTFVLPAT